MRKPNRCQGDKKTAFSSLISELAESPSEKRISNRASQLSAVQYAAERKVVSRSENPSRPAISSVSGGTQALQRLAADAVSSRLSSPSKSRKGRFASLLPTRSRPVQQRTFGRSTKGQTNETFFSGLQERLPGGREGRGNPVVDVGCWKRKHTLRI